MQYFPPTALLFESVRNPEKDHNLKPLKTNIFLDDAFDFYNQYSNIRGNRPGPLSCHADQTRISVHQFNVALQQCLSYCGLDSYRYKSWDT